MIRSQLAHRASRTLALFLGMLVATTAFTVLTGAADTSRLVVRGEVAKDFRSAYDILVRPAGSKSALETSQGLVRDSYLSGAFGGITMAQYKQVEGLDGVEVAAPAAIVGYAMQNVTIPVDLSKYVRLSGRQVLRVDVARLVDSGLSRVPGERTVFVYVTDELAAPPASPGNVFGPTETLPGGKRVVLCPWDAVEAGTEATQSGPFSEFARTETSCWSRRGQGFVNGQTVALPHSKVTVEIPWSFPYLIAAIDPEAEARLVGLDKAVTQGRYLKPSEAVSEIQPQGSLSRLKVKQVPLLLTSRPYATGADELTVSDLGAAGVATMTSGDQPADLRSALLQERGRPLGRETVGTAQAFSRLPGVAGPGAVPTGESLPIADLWTAGAPALTAKGERAVTVAPATLDPSVWDFSGSGAQFRPLAETLDTPFRPVTHHEGNNSGQATDTTFKIPVINIVGRYDPEKVTSGSDLASVPLSLYAPSRLKGADSAATAALKGGSLDTNGSMVGYAQEPPLMLTSLEGMAAFYAKDAFSDMGKAAQAPLGSIRVRVSGTVGIDDLSRERVRRVAEQITATTGLDVDIVIGSSPTPVTVDLPAGKYGRPDLKLQEGWVLKGVGVALLQGVDRKSVALFALILVVCSLFVANAAGAAVRSRRTELGVLSCLGWSRGMLFRVVLGELAVLGLAAGAAGALLSWPIAALAGLEVSPWRQIAAIPAAVLLAVVAGLGPARRAAAAHPASAVRPMVSVPRRPRSPRTLLGLAWGNLTRVPGRAALGALSLAVGVCALTILLGITRAFHGAAVGTLLGDAITLQVRGVDYLAVGATIALGALATADVLYLNVRERAGEFAALRAMGWPETALARVVAWEGLAIGVVGAVVGAALGVGLTGWFASAVPPQLLVMAGAAAMVGVAVTVTALAIPTAALRRLPTAALLADEE